MRTPEGFSLPLLYLPNAHFDILFEDFHCDYQYIDLHGYCQGNKVIRNFCAKRYRQIREPQGFSNVEGVKKMSPSDRMKGINNHFHSGGGKPAERLLRGC